MRLRSWLCCVACLTCLVAYPAGPAQAASGVALTAKAGTLGLGLDLSARLGSRFNLRVGGNAFTYDTEDEASDVDYDLELDLSSINLLLDWHPTGGGFRVTAGALINSNRIAATAVLEPGTTVEIGDVDYPAEALGDLTGEVSFDDLAPYLGIGFGNPFSSSGRVRFFLELGVVFQGTGEVSLEASDPLGIPGLEQELAKEEQEFQDDIDQFDLYPVVAIGLSVRL